MCQMFTYGRVAESFLTVHSGRASEFGADVVIYG